MRRARRRVGSGGGCLYGLQEAELALTLKSRKLPTAEQSDAAVETHKLMPCSAGASAHLVLLCFYIGVPLSARARTSLDMQAFGCCCSYLTMLKYTQKFIRTYGTYIKYEIQHKTPRFLPPPFVPTRFHNSSPPPRVLLRMRACENAGGVRKSVACHGEEDDSRRSEASTNTF